MRVQHIFLQSSERSELGKGMHFTCPGMCRMYVMLRQEALSRTQNYWRFRRVPGPNPKGLKFFSLATVTVIVIGRPRQPSQRRMCMQCEMLL